MAYCICPGGSNHLTRPPTVTVRIRLLEGRTQPLASIAFTLKVGNETHTGTTGPDGTLAVNVPASARAGQLSFQNLTVPIAIGKIRPVATCAGVQARLNNLGYEAGKVDGRWGPLTRAALRAFQRDNHVRASGKADEASQGKLSSAHGC